MKHTQRIAALALTFSCMFAPAVSAQGIAIGRSTLTLPDATRWAAQALTPVVVKFTGDRSVDLSLEGQMFVYRPATVAISAILISRVTTAGANNIQLRWNNTCGGVKAQDYVYKHDRSSSNDIDCLVVASIADQRAFLRAAPQLEKDLGGLRPDGNGFFVVEFTRSLGSGGVAHSNVLLATNFEGLDNTSLQHTSKLPTSLLAWAEEFAKANRNAIGSLSGNWSVPELVFQGQ